MGALKSIGVAGERPEARSRGGGYWRAKEGSELDAKLGARARIVVRKPMCSITVRAADVSETLPPDLGGLPPGDAFDRSRGRSTRPSGHTEKLTHARCCRRGAQEGQKRDKRRGAERELSRGGAREGKTCGLYPSARPRTPAAQPAQRSGQHRLGIQRRATNTAAAPTVSGQPRPLPPSPAAMKGCGQMRQRRHGHIPANCTAEQRPRHCKWPVHHERVVSTKLHAHRQGEGER